MQRPIKTLGFLPGDLINAVMTAKIAKEKQKHLEKLKAQGFTHEAAMRALDRAYKEKELASRMAISHRQDALFKDLALYVGLSLVVIVILVALGAIGIGKKGGVND